MFNYPPENNLPKKDFPSLEEIESAGDNNAKMSIHNNFQYNYNEPNFNNSNQFLRADMYLEPPKNNEHPNFLEPKKDVELIKNVEIANTYHNDHFHSLKDTNIVHQNNAFYQEGIPPIFRPDSSNLGPPEPFDEKSTIRSNQKFDEYYPDNQNFNQTPPSNLDDQFKKKNENFDKIDNMHHLDKDYQPKNINQAPIVPFNILNNNMMIPEPPTEIKPRIRYGQRDNDDNIIIEKNFRIFIRYLIYHFIILTLAISGTVMTSIFISKVRYSEASFFKKIYENWNSRLISSLSITDCKNSTDYLIQEQWPGTKAGCFCSTYIKSGFCSKSTFCRNVYPINPKPIINWRGTPICRISEINWKNSTYLDLTIENKQSDCPTGTRSCGLIDSYPNHLCVPNSKSCPVISLKFYDTDTYNNKKNTFPTDNKVIFFSNSAFVYNLNEKNFDVNKVQIPLDFEISNNQPCLNPYYQNIGSMIYTLDYYAGRNFCLKYADNGSNNTSFNYLTNYYYDSNFQIIDTLNMEKLYFDNEITSVTYALPLFPLDEYKRDINLYAKNYFGLSSNCLKTIKSENLKDDLMNDLKIITKITEINTGPMNTMVMISSALVFFLFLNGLGIIHRSKKTRKPIKIGRCEVCFYFIISFIAMIFTFVTIILLGVLLKNFQTSTAFNKIFGDTKCINPYTYDLYQILITSFNSFRTMIISSIILFIINIILLMIYSIIGFCATENSLYYDESGE